MLARSGRLPTSGDYAYEVKWDGFRAIVMRSRVIA
jgi:ATP-dependent DNA ligase